MLMHLAPTVLSGIPITYVYKMMDTSIHTESVDSCITSEARRRRISSSDQNTDWGIQITMNIIHALEIYMNDDTYLKSNLNYI